MKRNIKWLSILMIVAAIFTMPASVSAAEMQLSEVEMKIGSEPVEDREPAIAQWEQAERGRLQTRELAEGTRTVLYEDGTFIINELMKDRELNCAKHGSALHNYYPWNGENYDYVFKSVYDRPWHQVVNDIKAVEIGSRIYPENTANWFAMFYFAASAELANLETGHVTNMANMFMQFGYSAESVTITGLECWDTSQTTTMERMFDKCGKKAKQITISGFGNWDVRKVTTMENMFYELGSGDTTGKDAVSITTDKFDDWNTESVKYLNYMFYKVCHMEIGTFNINASSNNDYMFAGAEDITGYLKLHAVPQKASLGYDVNKNCGALYLAPTNTETLAWAEKAESIHGIDSTGKRKGYVYLCKDYLVSRSVLYADGTLILNERYNMQAENEERHGVVSKTYPAWDGTAHDYVFDAAAAPWYENRISIRRVEVGSKILPVNTSAWFFGCSGIQYADVAQLDMSKAVNTSNMFAECGTDDIVITGLRHWDMQNVQDASNMFAYFASASTGAVSPVQLQGIEQWKLSEGANLQGMFNHCGALQFQSITISDKCEISSMFAGANGVYGDVKINGIPLCDEAIQNGFARNTNVDHGALYLVPDDAAYTWAEREEAKYGLHGSITQGHVYLRKLFDFTVSESIVFTGDGGTNLTAGDLTVKNIGTGQIHVSRIELSEISDDWSITAWGTDFAILPKDSKKLSLSVAGVDLSECAYQQEEFLASGQQKTFSINGKTGVVSCPLRQAYIASLLVTVRTM